MVDEPLPEGISEIERRGYETGQRLARLISTGHFQEALLAVDELDMFADESERLVRLLRGADRISREVAKRFFKQYGVRKAGNEEKRALVLHELGRTGDAIRIYRRLLARTDLPDRLAFSSFYNLAGIHGQLGEKHQAWDAFRQAEEFHGRLPHKERDPTLIRGLRNQLKAMVGAPPRKRKPPRRGK